MVQKMENRNAIEIGKRIGQDRNRIASKIENRNRIEIEMAEKEIDEYRIGIESIRHVLLANRIDSFESISALL